MPMSPIGVRRSALVLAFLACGLAAGLAASRQGPPAGSPLRFTNPPTVAAPTGYSHLAVVAPGTELMFLAGQVGNRVDGSVPESAEEQYAQALRNVVALLAAEGATPADLVKVNTYLVRPLEIAKVRGMRQQLLGSVAPASTLVYVSRLAQERYLVEIEAVAVKRKP